MSTDAPGIDDRQLTPITDLASGQEILEQLPLANSALAEVELATFIDTLRAAPPPLETYLTLLEQARLPLQFIAEDLARGYIGKPLPLGEHENQVFQRMIDAWRRMARAYDHCAQLDNTEDTPDHAARIALVLHRCISYMGTAIIEHHRARREIPPGLWLELHGYYDTAEEWHVASIPVIDTLDPQQRNSTGMSIFAMLLLVDMTNPYGLGVREQGIIRRWASNWASLVDVKLVDQQTESSKPEYVIDLIQDTGLYPASFDSSPSTSQRYLDTSRLTAVINQAKQQLRERMTPAQIGLGEDCTPSQAMRLLLIVSKPWSQASTPRRFRRHSATGKIKVCANFDGIYYHINGKEFAQPLRRNQFFSQQEQGKVFTVSVSASEQGTQVVQSVDTTKYPLGDWDMVNQSASGFRIVKSQADEKFEHSQLLALCPHSGGRFLLGQITWLMQEDRNRLAAGVAILPGLPQAVCIRPLDKSGAVAPYSRALLLPKIAAVKEEASLVLPLGWFQRDKVLEVFTDHPFHVRLTRVFTRGTDFERIGYEAAL